MMIIRQSDTKYWLPTSTTKENSSLKVIFFDVSVLKKIKCQNTAFLMATFQKRIYFYTLTQQKRLLLNLALRYIAFGTLVVSATSSPW